MFKRRFRKMNSYKIKTVQKYEFVFKNNALIIAGVQRYEFITNRGVQKYEFAAQNKRALIGAKITLAQ